MIPLTTLAVTPPLPDHWPSRGRQRPIGRIPFWILPVAVGCANDALAQAQQPGINSGSAGSWGVPLAIALILATLAAAFWNRRLAHEKRERRRLEQRLFDLTHTLPAGVVEYKVGPDGSMKCLFANPSARTMLRLPAGEHTLSLNDPAFLTHVHPDDHERLRAVTRRSVDSLDPINVSFQFMRTDGQYRWLQAEMAVRVMTDGALVWTGSIHDTTEQRQLECELENMVASKDLFFAAASRALRKPIYEIGLALDQFLDEHPPTDSDQSAADQPVQRAQSASQRLRALIDDLLELVKVQRDDFPLRPGHFSLSDFLKELECEMQIPFARKSLKLLIQLDPALPDTLYGDHKRIHQVLLNLINNALRHTDKGGVTVSVVPVASVKHSTVIAGPRQVRLRFVVTDTGCGIGGEQLARLFQPLVSNEAIATDALARRGAPTAAGNSQGTGMGLAIGERIVTRMGGTIDIQSIPGSGTTVYVELPLETRSPAALTPVPVPVSVNGADQPANPAMAERRVKTPLRKARRVLLVDDDKLGRTLLATLLGSDGYQVTEAGNGADALTKLEHNRFDAVVTDLRMPGMDGRTLATNIQQRYTKDPLLTARPRLIALSASLGGNDASESSNDVFDVLLQKPVALDELVGVLESTQILRESDKA